MTNVSDRIPGRERNPDLLAWRQANGYPWGMVTPGRAERRQLAREGKAKWLGKGDIRVARRFR